MNRTAKLSPDGLYRYSLTRRWDGTLDLPALGLIMLNPSTADDKVDDPTVRAAVLLARRWGYGALIVGNLFAWRSPSTANLNAAFKSGVAVGLENDFNLRLICELVEEVMVGWGSEGARYLPRVQQVDHLIRDKRRSPKCIGVTASGHPKHPLLRFHTTAQKQATRLTPWELP